MPLSTAQIKTYILKYISEHPGCNAIELITKSGIADETHSLDLPCLLETMVNSGEITELEYTLPSKPYQIKSIYFLNKNHISLTSTKDGINIYCDFDLRFLLPKHTKTTIHRYGNLSA